MNAASRRRQSKPQRQLRYILTAGACLISLPSYALTIGTPEFDSYLAQPLRVVVPVNDLATGLKPRDFGIRILPASDYARLGLAQPEFPLDQLELRWLDSSGDTPARLFIGSRRAMNEPLLTLLLEISGPRQRWIKQLDLLLDPAPLTAQSNAKRADDASAATQRSLRVKTAEMRPQRRTYQTSRGGMIAQQYGPIKPGEVLSIIAQQVRPDPSIPLAQMAQAIMDVNPSAFPSGPSSLSAGDTLTIPDQAAIAKARNNESLMQPPEQTAHVSSRSTGATAQKTSSRKDKTFLPPQRYLNGLFYALTTEFLSYEKVRPVNLQPTLEKLEATEPFRFKADWTLSRAAPAPTSINSVAEIRAAPDVTKEQPAEASTAEAASEGAATDTQSIADREPAQPTTAADTTAQPGIRLEDVATQTVRQDDPVQLDSRAANNAVEAPAADTADEVAEPANTTSNNWIWLFLLALTGLGLWWWKRGRWQSISPDDPADTSAAAISTKEVSNSGTTRQAILLKRQLNPLLANPDEGIVRQAKVALTLFDRGHLEEAQKLINDLKTQAAEAPTAAPDPIIPTPAPQASPQAFNSNAESNSSEFEQHRVLKLIRKQIGSAGLSEEARRQLKVAEALCERGRSDKAEQILQQLQQSDASISQRSSG